jgi:ribosomal-protein-alanine N-acetyltransferase
MSNEADLGQPVSLSTQRLRLVAPDVRQARDLYAYGSLPEFTAFLDATPFKSEADAVSFIESLREDNRQDIRMYWVAERIDDGRAIGTLGLIFHYAPRHRVAEFGYGFSPETWGTGLSAEAAHRVIDYAGDDLGYHRLEFYTRAANHRSIRAVEKLGFRRDGTLLEFFQETDGGRGDAAVLGLLRPGKARHKA